MFEGYSYDAIKHIIDGDYSYYLGEDGIADTLADIFRTDSKCAEETDDRADFYHDYFAYQEGWAA